MTNDDAATVLAKQHLRLRQLVGRVMLKRSLHDGERVRWRDSVTYEMLALEHAYFALTGRRMWLGPTQQQARAANDR